MYIMLVCEFRGECEWAGRELHSVPFAGSSLAFRWSWGPKSNSATFSILCVLLCCHVDGFVVGSTSSSIMYQDSITHLDAPNTTKHLQNNRGVGTVFLVAPIKLLYNEYSLSHFLFSYFQSIPSTSCSCQTEPRVRERKCCHTPNGTQ